MLVLVNQLGLIGGFAFYFSGWHGRQAFIDIKNYLQSEDNISQLWRKAVPFTVLALFFSGKERILQIKRNNMGGILKRKCVKIKTVSVFGIINCNHFINSV